MASTSQLIEDYFKNRVEQIDPNRVVVLKSPDPTTVVPGARRFLNADHIKWILKNSLVDCSKYVKEELTGARVFWVENPEEVIKKYSSFTVPLNPKSKKAVSTKTTANNATTTSTTTITTASSSASSTKSYAEAAQPG